MVVIIVVFLLDEREREREREAVLNRYHYRIFLLFLTVTGGMTRDRQMEGGERRRRVKKTQTLYRVEEKCSAISS